jgi:hypothetical protein
VVASRVLADYGVRLSGALMQSRGGRPIRSLVSAAGPQPDAITIRQSSDDRDYAVAVRVGEATDLAGCALVASDFDP